MTNKYLFTSIEICAGGGGQALGLEQAGFKHEAVIEIDSHACKTLRANRPNWNVIEGDLLQFHGKPYRGIDLFAGGVPCPPFSIAGKQLGSMDDRDLFPEALRLIAEVRPKAIMLENVKGLASKKFANYRAGILRKLIELGYRCNWRMINASDYGVPQLRPRFILIALRKEYADNFAWPLARKNSKTVGTVLFDLMDKNKWPGAKEWSYKANGIAPTIVGGSKKHGGPDLGPTRAKQQWREYHVDGMGIADLPPGPNFPKIGMPKLTIQMVARIQGFPDSWKFIGGKTAAYRQVGNAFPPPVAKAVGGALAKALLGSNKPVPIGMGLNAPLLELMER